jgi:hypothetical protein
VDKRKQQQLVNQQMKGVKLQQPLTSQQLQEIRNFIQQQPPSQKQRAHSQFHLNPNLNQPPAQPVHQTNQSISMTQNKYRDQSASKTRNNQVYQNNLMGPGGNKVAQTNLNINNNGTMIQGSGIGMFGHNYQTTDNFKAQINQRQMRMNSMGAQK